ncbi:MULTISPECIES: CinA family protein [Nesterenkonia]|uniref:Nicotinamide-nucleotide amidase n=1 Tax=Nesterenkonia aurantiaca TaxID=1436010 RepID=A0A4R7G2V8_9MICC|nr:nicotinamide-nucleotide amidase [Nesterenkonia aurantiaca]
MTDFSQEPGAVSGAVSGSASDSVSEAASGKVSGHAGEVARAAERRTEPRTVIQSLGHRDLTLATAESLTAGGLSSRIAEVPGTSVALLGGVVAYSSAVKRNVLDVDAQLLQDRGAVDPDVAAAMARGVASVTGADIGIATTGVAGPEAHEGKDVGTVYLGLACRKTSAQRLGLSLPAGAEPAAAGLSPEAAQTWLSGSLLLDLHGDRGEIRAASVEGALKLVEDFLLTEPHGIGDRD